MRNSALILRPHRLVSAYAIAPLFGVVVAWLVECLASGGLLSVRSLFLLPWALMLGYPLILVTELALITPVVWAHRVYRFRWLNAFSACLIAATVGGILGFWFGSIPAAPGVHPPISGMFEMAVVTSATAVAVAFAFRMIAYQTPRPTPSGPS